MNEMQYIGGAGGAMVSGRWINRQNGMVVNVRDSIIDGDNMIIITDRGQIDLATFSNDYIQASDDIYDEKGNKIGTETLDTSDIVTASTKIELPKNNNKNALNEYELIDEIVVDNNVTSDNSASNINTQKEKSKVFIEQEQKANPYDAIIDKVFSKIQQKPKITIGIDWDDIPTKQIDTLINYLDVPLKDIAEYIIDKYVNKQTIADNITDNIIKHLSYDNV